ncbi:MAG: hypothetical protein ACXVBJ_13515 [Flavisolibacter sp.]
MKTSTFLIAIATIFGSCTHVYYAPNTANAPLLSEKGEVRINGFSCGGWDSEFSGGEFQLATAITKHVGIMTNGMFVGKTEEVSGWNESHMESGKGSYGEIAGGLFTAFDPKKKCIGEIYAGVGTGSVNSTYEGNQNSKVGITKLFLQPSLGFKSRYFEAAFVPKISFLNWKVKSDNLPDGGFGELAPIRQKPNLVQFEPTFFMRAGGENVKLQGSLSFSDSHGYYPIERLTASFGVSIDIKPKKK